LKLNLKRHGSQLLCNSLLSELGCHWSKGQAVSQINHQESVEISEAIFEKSG
jgi:hypothetical protein